jgi:hypothetical protein
VVILENIWSTLLTLCIICFNTQKFYALFTEYFLVFIKFSQYCYLCCSFYCLCVNVYCHRVTTQLLLINIMYHIATTSVHNNNRSGLTTDSFSVYCEVGTKFLNICYIKFVLRAMLCHVSGRLSPPFSEKARVRFRPSICKIYGEKIELGQVFLREIRLSLFGAVTLQLHANLSISDTFICRTNSESLGTFGYRWVPYRHIISYSWLKAVSSDVLQQSSYVLHITCLSCPVCDTHILCVLMYGYSFTIHFVTIICTRNKFLDTRHKSNCAAPRLRRKLS